MKSLVSIIMPTFNSIDTLKESIDSILNQTYENWELLITDDASTDGTQEILKAYVVKDSRIKVFFNDFNQGAGASRNISIENSCGRYIAFLDSDDLWHNEKLEKQIGFMCKHDHAFTYTHYRKITETGELAKKISCPTNNVRYHELLKSNVIGCLTVIYDAHMLGKIYMPSIRKRQDYALWLKILNKIEFAWCLHEELAFYRMRKKSLSSSKIKIIFSQWFFYRKYLNLGFFKSIYFFYFYACNAIHKHYISS